MRRSVRESRRPEFLTYQGPPSSKKFQSIPENEVDEAEEDEDIEVDSVFEERLAGGKRKKRGHSSSSAVAGKEDDGESDLEEEGETEVKSKRVKKASAIRKTEKEPIDSANADKNIYGG